MKKYTYNQIDCGFIILCSERALNLLKTTANSIKSNYPGFPFICVADTNANKADIEEMSLICPTYQGKDTFSSLINEGLKNTKTDWNFFIFAGTSVRPNMDKKFAFFLESEKDILFPIVDRKTNFVDATINGLFLNKKAYKEVGKIDDAGNFEAIKLMWALTAIDKGYKFKAIANTKIC